MFVHQEDKGPSDLAQGELDQGVIGADIKDGDEYDIKDDADIKDGDEDDIKNIKMITQLL